METLKFALFSIVVLTLLGLGGYWAVSTIQSGSEYVSTDRIKKLENANQDLNKEVENLQSQLGLLQQAMKDAREVQSPTVAQNPEPKSPTPAAPSTGYKNQQLINELQKLIDANVLVRLKSQGTRVGTLQKFFNVYNNTSNKIDNDFGESMKTALIKFQKDQGLAGDGEAGKTSFAKMISWLKQQG